MKYWPIIAAIIILVFCWCLSGKNKKQQFRKYLVVVFAIIVGGCSTVIHLPPQPVYNFEQDSIAQNILDFYHVCNKISIEHGDVDLYDFSDKSFDLKVTFIDSEFIPGGIREVWKFTLKDTLGRHFEIEDFVDHPKLDPNTNVNLRIEGVKNRIQNPGR